MKKQHLIVLGLALVLLFGLKYLLGSSRTRTITDLSEAGISELIPSSLDRSSIRWVRVTTPDLPPDPESEAAGVVGKQAEARSSDGQSWVMASAHGVEADAGKIDEFLDALFGVTGELRGDHSNLHEDFGVSDAQAVKVELGAAAGDAGLTLLLGKTGDRPGSHFVRVAGEEPTWHVTEGLRDELNLYSERTELSDILWVQLEVIDVDETSITGIEYDGADARYVLSKGAAGSDGAQTAPAGGGTWSVVEPALPYDARAASLSAMPGRLARLRVSSVLDPGSAECALGPEAAIVRLTRAGGDDVEIQVGTKLTATEEVPVVIAGREGCYGLSKWTAESAFPRASQVYEFVKAYGDDRPAESEATWVRYERGGESLTFERAEGEPWQLKGEGEPNTGKVDHVVRSVLGLNYDDFAEESKVSADRLEVEATVRVKAGGRDLRLEILGERQASPHGERYVRAGGGTEMESGFVGLLKQTVYKPLLVQPSELKTGPAS
ncbi:MAG: DUF4340 domain-containing protein [Acidobacteriota bacterium]